MQNNGKERQKACCTCKFVFVLFQLEKKVCCTCNLFFCWLDLLILMPFSLPSTLSITRFNFFCLQVLLTRDSLLALAKSIYYFIIVAVKILIEALKVRLRYYNFYPVEELVYLIWFNCTHLLVLSLRKTSREIKENKVMVRLQLTLKLVKLRDQVPCIIDTFRTFPCKLSFTVDLWFRWIIV